MNGDSELLRQFADEDAQDAFAELVRRKINLVYASALRQVGHDAHLAQDVTQAVFLALACRARSLKRHPALTGWLHTTTRFLATKAVRTQRRWQQREEAAQTMNPITTPAEPAWEQLRPIIDEALHEIGERDREAILLRFFEGRTFAEVGAAVGLSENSARMRVDRALEKLRQQLGRRGLTSTAAALGTILAHQPAIAAPAAFVTSVVSGALAGTTLAGGGILAIASLAWPFMGTTKILIGAAALCAAIGIGSYFGAQIQSRGSATWERGGSERNDAALAASRREIERLRSEVERLRASNATLDRARESAGASPLASRQTSSALENLRVLMDLQKRKVAKLEVQFVDDYAKLSPAFAELFALTPAEQEKLQQSIEASRQQLAELERANATIGRAPNGNVVISVNAFPEAGGAVYDALIKAFSETLGPDRHQAFLSLGVEQVERTLGRFGTPQRTLTFSQKVGQKGDVHYGLREDLRLPSETSNYSTDFKTFEEMSRKAGTIVNLLPTDFAPKK